MVIVLLSGSLFRHILVKFLRFLYILLRVAGFTIVCFLSSLSVAPLTFVFRIFSETILSFSFALSVFVSFVFVCFLLFRQRHLQLIDYSLVIFPCFSDFDFVIFLQLSKSYYLFLPGLVCKFFFVCCLVGLFFVVSSQFVSFSL